VTDLVRWLGEQLDEDERVARVAMRLPGGVPGEQWRVSGSHSDAGGTYWSITNASSDIDRVPTLEMVGSGMSGGGAHTEDVATHIAAHDPARVLREIDAKRELLRRYEALAAGVLVLTSSAREIQSEYRRVILPSLAAGYSDRPGYREEWRP
jgi:hypothetical protein